MQTCAGLIVPPLLLAIGDAQASRYFSCASVTPLALAIHFVIECGLLIAYGASHWTMEWCYEQFGIDLGWGRVVIHKTIGVLAVGGAILSGLRLACFLAHGILL